MPLDATQPTDSTLISQFASFIREVRAQVNTLAAAITAFGATTSFTLVSAASYTITDADSAVIADATGNAISISLPLANTVFEGFSVKVKKSDADLSNTVTVWRQGADTIDNSTNYPLTLEGESAVFVSDGVSKWYKFN